MQFYKGNIVPFRALASPHLLYVLLSTVACAKKFIPQSSFALDLSTLLCSTESDAGILTASCHRSLYTSYTHLVELNKIEPTAAIFNILHLPLKKTL